MHKLEDCDWDDIELKAPTEERSNGPAFRDLLVDQLNTQAQVSQEHGVQQPRRPIPAQPQALPPAASQPAAPPVPPPTPASEIPFVPAVIEAAIPLFGDEGDSVPSLEPETTPGPTIATPETGRLADLAKRLEGKLKRRAEDG